MSDWCDALRYAMITMQGYRKERQRPVSDDPIDQKTGNVNVYMLCPEPGDSVMIVNCGTHYEVRQHSWEPRPLYLTDEDIERIKHGEVTWH